MKDLVCGNVDKIMVEAGYASCGSSEMNSDLECTMTNYMKLSEDNSNFPEMESNALIEGSSNDVSGLG